MVFKNEVFENNKAEDIVARGNIAQFEQYFLFAMFNVFKCRLLQWRILAVSDLFKK